MAMSEPPAWTQARDERMQQQYFQLKYTDPSMLMKFDNYQLNNGAAPSDFSQNVMRLANYATREV